MAHHTQLETAVYTVLLPAIQRTGGTAIAGTFIAVGQNVNHVLHLNIGTVTAGSVTQLIAQQGTAAAPGGGTATISGGIPGGGTSALLTVGGGGTTAGMFSIEVTTPNIPSGSAFIGCEVVIPTGGTAIFDVVLEQIRFRNLPTSNGLAGSLLILG